MSAQKPREIAARVLLRRERGEDFAENLLESELSRSNLSTIDRGLCTELVYGTVRRQRTLDWLISRKTQPGRSQKAELQVLLRLGLYQLFWLGRIPDHAAVHETVELAKRLGFAPQAGFLNAILRAYTREKNETEQLLENIKESDPALATSHPEWLAKKWTERYGAAKACELLEWNNLPAYSFARVNTLKTDAQTLTKQWEEEGVQFTPRQYAWTGENLVFQLDWHPPLSKLRSFQEGLFYIQDPSTLLSVHELAPQPGETVLDMCAAPGGKCTFIAQLMKNRGRIIAQDIDPDRLNLVKENCVRLGVVCVHYAVLEDSSTGKNESRTPQFDRVLIDAPCSNTGVLRRRVDLRWRIRPEEIERLQKTQMQLLRNAAPKLKTGGTLVYSTCSLEPEENKNLIHQFIAEFPQFNLERERDLNPVTNAVDGAYVARLTLN